MAARRRTQQPARLRCQANARERDRTQSVNTAFSALRTLIPTQPADRKLSKIETLKLATSYIKHLLSLLVNDGFDESRISCDGTSECCFCTREQYHSTTRTSKVTANANKSNGSTYSVVPSNISHCL